ncbi:MAG: hypothetical protein NVSMB19_15960 [Vulcanimicrobiaceae bacterium]
MSGGLVAFTCVGCRFRNVCATGTHVHTAGPRVGDVTICRRCGRPYRFNAELHAEALLAADLSPPIRDAIAILEFDRRAAARARS